MQDLKVYSTHILITEIILCLAHNMKPTVREGPIARVVADTAYTN